MCKIILYLLFLKTIDWNISFITANYFIMYMNVIIICVKLRLASIKIT